MDTPGLLLGLGNPNVWDGETEFWMDCLVPKSKWASLRMAFEMLLAQDATKGQGRDRPFVVLRTLPLHGASTEA